MAVYQMMVITCLILAIAMLMLPTVLSAPVGGLINRLKNTTLQDASATSDLSTNFTISATALAPVYSYLRESCDTDAECQAIVRTLFCVFEEGFDSKVCNCEEDYVYKDGDCVINEALLITTESIVSLTITAVIVLSMLGLTLAMCINKCLRDEWKRNRLESMNSVYPYVFAD